MKSKVLAFAFGLVVSLSAAASPVLSLPGGPVFFKFTGREQIAVGGAHTGNGVIGDAAEINWGVFTVDTLSNGHVDTPHVQISPTGAPLFVNGLGGQITGMFYGIDSATPNPGDPFPASGGYLDLYWRDMSSMSFTDVGTSTVAGLRTATNKATGYTDGTLLAHLKFTHGIDAADPTITISGSVTPNALGFTGEADSFANVDNSVVGAWSTALATQYYTTAFGTADIKFKNSYNQLTTWNDATNPAILGAKLDDPGQAFAVPEPGIMSLMGLAMLGMAAVRRRRQA